MKDSMTSSLPNYIRTLRRRTGLSQEELAFLAGGLRGSSLVRHENFGRTPGLETALLYAAIFQTDPREVFAGLHEKVETRARRRAKQLLRSSKGQLPTKALEQKVAFLEGLSGTREPHYVPCEEY